MDDFSKLSILQVIQPNIPDINLNTFILDHNIDQSKNAHATMGGFSWDMVSYHSYHSYHGYHIEPSGDTAQYSWHKPGHI